MNKQEILDELERHKKAITELEEKLNKPEVKPLFPKSWEEGARAVVHSSGYVEELTEDNHGFVWVEDLAEQGRTFYTLEAAKAFAKRERAQRYCLERINEVNEGDNGFRVGSMNYYLSFNHDTAKLFRRDTRILQPLEPNEYIRTKEAVEQLINDPEFVENWKIWKGVE